MIDSLMECLDIMEFMLQKIEVKDGLLDNKIYDCLFTVEEANRLATQGVPFREAYRTVGEQVQNGTFVASRVMNHSHEGSMGNLCNEKIVENMQSLLENFSFAQVNDALDKLISV